MKTKQLAFQLLEWFVSTTGPVYEIAEEMNITGQALSKKIQREAKELQWQKVVDASCLTEIYPITKIRKNSTAWLNVIESYRDVVNSPRLRDDRLISELTVSEFRVLLNECNNN